MKIVDNVLVEVDDNDIKDGTIEIPNNVTSIGEKAFYNCISLKKINIPDNVTSIGDGAFDVCSSLETITIPKGVTSIGKCVFEHCILLESIILPDSLTNIGENAFLGCTSLKEIIIPESVTSIDVGAFYGCKSLKTITIPESITSIDECIFSNCMSLETIIFPKKIISIGNHAFNDCSSLKEITIPESVTSIGRYAFHDCTSLKKIIIPNGITSIGECAFYNCRSLKEITIPESITSIKKGVFYDCRSLKEVNIPESVASIGGYAFNHCHSLERIIIPDNVTSIGKDAFDNCNSLNQLITPYGSVEIDNYTFVIQSYLYLYANSILKDKYSDFNNFLDNYYIGRVINSDLIYKKDAILKFKNLFYKLRKNFNISHALFETLSLEETEKFDYKIWNQIRDLVDTDNIEMAEAVSEMIAIFGLFENDNGARGRLQNYIDFIHNKNVILTDNIPKYADRVDCICYCLKPEVVIPEEFNIDLTNTLTEKEMKNVKKLIGNYGKRINDFVKENYEIVHTVGYKVEGNPVFYENGNFVNYSTLHTMFDGCDKKFDIDFYNFFMKYIDTILKNEIYQRRVKDIQKNFQDIKAYYKLHAGIDDITLKQAINYVENMKFDNIHAGNIEFAKDVKKAGVASQQAFEYYQKIYESNDKRKLTSLVKRSSIYEINGYKIKAELLRKDDSFGMLVGETNYTNCCQVFGGVGHNCLAHAVNSDDGGIFVTKLVTDEGEILLTESWDWQNNNVYCHDNIEGTPYFKNNEALHDAVAKAIELDALEIIRKSKEEVEKYIIERRKKIERSLLSNEEKTKKLEGLAELENREVIRLVTVGAGNSDLYLSDYYANTINVANTNIFNHQVFTLSNFQPVNYNSTQVYFDSEESAYSDAKSTQYIITGSVEELSLGKLEPLVPIYRDERRIIEESKEDIRDYTFSKMKKMEEKVYPKDMQQYTNDDSLEDSHIILGEDWYLVYEERDNNSIYISDLVRIEPELDDEKGIQNKEIMNSLNSLLETYDEIEADLKEDTSYLLYLMNKKLGYIEQIGEDTSYLFKDESNSTTISETDQANILKNIKQIRQDKNPNLIMHHVKFKKKDKILDNDKKTR